MKRRAIRLAAVAACAAAFVGLFGGVQATGDEAGIYGYGMTSSATAVMFTYDQPSFGLPASPTFELRKVHSLATVDSGPSGRALASTVWPGDIVANAHPSQVMDVFLVDPTRDGHLGPLLGPLRDGFKDGIRDGCADRDCTWPVRAETFHPQGPAERNASPGLGVEMESHAREASATALTAMQDAGTSGALSIGAMTAAASTAVVKDVAVSEARTFLSDIDLLGQIRIEQMASVARAESTGTGATLKGSVSISGMTIGGQRIVVDGSGLHAGSVSADPYGQIAKQIVDDHLTPRGISIEIVQPVDLADGPSASRVVSGLVVTMDSRAMNAFVDGLPDPYRSWIRNPGLAPSPLAPLFAPFTPGVAGLASSPTQFDQQMRIVLGSVGVDATASPPFDLDIPEIPEPETPVEPPPDPIVDPIAVEPEAAPPAVAPRRIVRRATQGTRPVAVAGLPAAAGALVGLAGLAGVLVLPRLADRATRPGRRGVGCPHG